MQCNACKSVTAGRSGTVTGCRASAWASSPSPRPSWGRSSHRSACCTVLCCTVFCICCAVQVGLALYGDSAEDVTLIEDSLITGVLRERLPHVRCRSRTQETPGDTPCSAVQAGGAGGAPPALAAVQLVLTGTLVQGNLLQRPHHQQAQLPGRGEWIQC